MNFNSQQTQSQLVTLAANKRRILSCVLMKGWGGVGHSGNTNGLLAERVHAGEKVFRSFYEHLISFFFLSPVLWHDALSLLEAVRPTAVNPN